MTLAISTNLLAPAALLVLWSLVVMIWMVARRFPALKTVSISKEAMVGGRGQDLDRILPKQINWPAHNYAHLMEQPTIFYPTIIMLAVLGQGTAVNVGLAWAYVALRIVHSFWQINVNTIPVRASLFFLSSALLLILAAKALLAAIS